MKYIDRDMADQPKGSATGRRPLENLVGLGRSAIQSHFRMAQETPPAGLDYPPLENFDNADIWPWIASWLKATYETDIESLFVPADKKHAFPQYPATGEQGHYDLAGLGLSSPGGSIRIDLAGDWGTGTDPAQQVAKSMVNRNPDLTIHLGDIYYVGTRDQVDQNCLGDNMGGFQGVHWATGSKGSFALNGNHEMYSGGSGYFDAFLPTLGIPASQDQKQLTSYFCLETPVWRILAIDTGYNSDTLVGDCKLEQSFLDRLHKQIDPINNRKPTVLLSHHQWFSGFGNGDYGKPADQMAPFLQKQEIVWLWGHEHRMAIYERYQSPGDHLTAYGRCIGHGGMPVEMPDEKVYPNGDRAQRVEFWDGPKRCSPTASGNCRTELWWERTVLRKW